MSLNTQDTRFALRDHKRTWAANGGFSYPELYHMYQRQVNPADPLG